MAVVKPWNVRLDRNARATRWPAGKCDIGCPPSATFRTVPARVGQRDCIVLHKSRGADRPRAWGA
jgi:hypothetical protein